jgi:STE24 endopeptidase
MAESAAGRLAPLSWIPGVTVVVYVGFLSLINELGSIPIGWYSGHVVERRYGLSNESLSHWVSDEIKSLGIGMVLGCGGATLV